MDCTWVVRDPVWEKVATPLEILSHALAFDCVDLLRIRPKKGQPRVSHRFLMLGTKSLCTGIWSVRCES